MKNRDGFVEFKYRLKNENKDNIIRYIVKIDGNKYVCKNLIQCAYIDYLVEKLEKMTGVTRIELYKKYMPKLYKKVYGN